MEIDLTKTKELIEKYRGVEGNLIPLLQDIQAEYRYVPEEAIELVAKELDVYPVEIYGILTFYSQFYLKPRGKNVIRVCQGTACHVMGAKDILDHISERLEIGDNETTKDGEFTLERVACLGCCGMAPVIVVNDKFHGNLTVPDLDALIDSYRTKE